MRSNTEYISEILKSLTSFSRGTVRSKASCSATSLPRYLEVRRRVSVDAITTHTGIGARGPSMLCVYALDSDNGTSNAVDRVPHRVAWNRRDRSFLALLSGMRLDFTEEAAAALLKEAANSWNRRSWQLKILRERARAPSSVCMRARRSPPPTRWTRNGAMAQGCTHSPAFRFRSRTYSTKPASPRWPGRQCWLARRQRRGTRRCRALEESWGGYHRTDQPERVRGLALWPQSALRHTEERLRSRHRPHPGRFVVGRGNFGHRRHGGRRNR
jgi:hypothetical protein